MSGGAYAYRTRKPGARYNLPILSRHFAYVGQTSSFWHRHRQHSEGKPWADLDPACYRIPLPDWKWLRLVVEQLLIWALWPVYNVQGNRWNPRRITPIEARRQRMVRNRGRHPLNLTAAHGIVWGVLAALVAYAMWRAGR